MRLNQKLANRVYVSTIREYSGLKLKNDSLECIEIVSVEDFSGLNDTEGRFG